MTTQVKKREYLRNPLKREIHDNAPHVMHLTDIDAVLYRKRSRIMRIVECKYRNEPLRKSQQDILPVLADCIKLAINTGIIAQGSGVYLARYDEGDNLVLVKQIGEDYEQEIPLKEFLHYWACCYPDRPGTVAAQSQSVLQKQDF